MAPASAAPVSAAANSASLCTRRPAAPMITSRACIPMPAAAPCGFTDSMKTRALSSPVSRTNPPSGSQLIE